MNAAYTGGRPSPYMDPVDPFKSAAPARIQEAIEGVSRGIDGLRNGLETLRERLIPVLRPAEPRIADGGCGKASTIESPVAAVTARHSSELAELNGIIDDLLNRLDV